MYATLFVSSLTDTCITAALLSRAAPSVQVDVLVVYSAESLWRVIGGVTAAQMETLIADEIPTANEAATNSEIDIRFNLVHTAPVSKRPCSVVAQGCGALSRRVYVCPPATTPSSTSGETGTH